MTTVHEVMTPRRECAGVRAIRASFAAANDVDELLTTAVSQALATCSFERGIVLSVEGRWLRAPSARAADDEASDALRRLALATPIALRGGTLESELVRTGGSGDCRPSSAASPLRDQLGLRQFAIAPVVVDGAVAALLVIDRSSGATTESEQDALEVIAQLLGLAVEGVVLRARLIDLVSELQHLTVSANALAGELGRAPVTLSSTFTTNALFVTSEAAQVPEVVDELLTARERDVAALVANGLSNRAIGEALFISAETVKMHVASLARKLDAANRAQIAARWTGLQMRAA